MSAPDLLRTLQRADQRWTTKHADDPAPQAYIQHLADAVTPLIQPGAAPVDLDTSLNDAAPSTNDAPIVGVLELERQLAEANDKLEQALQDAAGWKAAHDGRVTTHAETERALNQARAERDTARAQLKERNCLLNQQLQAAKEDLAAQAIQVQQPREDLERALEQKRAADFNYETANAGYTVVLEHLGRLVDAVNEEWHPDGDLAAQVDRAVQLVGAAATQLNDRAAAGRHVCQWPINQRTGRPGPCTCGKRLPKAAAALVGATRGQPCPST
ncbi:MAG: hypothetical protein ACJ72N_06990 [Labedaea sp.]